MFAHILKFVTLAVVSFSFGAHAFEDEDLEAGTEEAVADSDATSEQARLAHARAIQAQKDALQRTREAEQMKVRADAKAVDAAKSLAESEMKIAEMKAEAQRQIKLRRASEALIALEETKLRQMSERLDQAHVDLDAIEKMRAEKDLRLRDLRRQIEQTRAGIQSTGQQLTQTRAELKRREDLVQGMEAEVSALKQKYKSALAAHAVESARVASLKTKQQAKTEQLDFARAQVRAPAARLQSRGGSPASAPTRTAPAPAAKSMVLPSGDR